MADNRSDENNTIQRILILAVHVCGAVVTKCTFYPMCFPNTTDNGGGSTDGAYHEAWVILGIGSANERRRYNVTSSLIGWAYIQNDPCEARTNMNTSSWGNQTYFLN